jgi:hypothetical protein
LALLEVLTEGVNDATNRGSKTTETKRCEEGSNLGRKVLEKTGSLASLEVFAESGNDTANGG